MNSSHLSRIEGGQKNPPRRSTVEKLSVALRLSQEQQKQFFEAAGYFPPRSHEPVGFSSPLKFDIGPVKPSLGELIRRLDKPAHQAVKEVVDLLVLQDLTPVEAKLLARQIRIFARTLKTLKQHMQTQGRTDNNGRK